MNIKEITEGFWKNKAIDAEFDRQNSPGPAPTIQKPKMNYAVVVKGKVWKEFPTEQLALRAATSMQANRPHLRPQVMPL